MGARRKFDLQERVEQDGWVRLTISGELDLAVAGELGTRLRALAGSRQSVKLDLSELDFIDSTGIRALITAVSDSRERGWELQIEPILRPQVKRVVDLMGLAPHFFPERD